MPGFDSSGPRGSGPMTGGGRGFCAVAGTRLGRRSGIPCGGWGRRGGRRLLGFFPGSGRRNMADVGLLRNQAQMMEEELEYLRDRITQIEGEEN